MIKTNRKHGKVSKTGNELTLLREYWGETDHPEQYVLRMADGSAAMGLDYMFTKVGTI